MPLALRRASLLPLLLLSIPACAGTVTDPDSGPFAAEIVGGNAQHGVAGNPLGQPLVVRITNLQGKPAKGVDVAWITEAEGAQFSADATRTDGAGKTQTHWTLGTRAGPQTVELQAGGTTLATFSAEANPGPPAAVIISPQGPALELDQTVSLAATLVDEHGNVRPDSEFVWTSSNEIAASVDAAGRVTGRGPGSSSIAASAVIGSAGPLRGEVTVSVLVDWVEVSAGERHTCATVATGRTFCWGESYGPLPVPLPEAGPFRSLSRGWCGQTADGVAYCWGRHWAGDLGMEPVQVFGGVPARMLRAYGHTCAILADSRTECWGYNLYGQLGDGTQESRTTSVEVSGGYPFQSIAVGGAFACAMTAPAETYCWGNNEFHQLGRTDLTEDCGREGFNIPCSTVPVRAASELAFASISAGGAHACGLTPAGGAYCWGENLHGKLGTTASSESCTVNKFPCSSQPLPVEGGHTFASLHASGGFTCGITPEGKGLCWGINYYGHLGNGQGDPFGTGVGSHVPTAISGGLTFTQLSTGGDHACGLTDSKSIYCWGKNAHSQLGDGKKLNSNVPIKIIGSR